MDVEEIDHIKRRRGFVEVPSSAASISAPCIKGATLKSGRDIREVLTNQESSKTPHGIIRSGTDRGERMRFFIVSEPREKKNIVATEEETSRKRKGKKKEKWYFLPAMHNNPTQFALQNPHQHQHCLHCNATRTVSLLLIRSTYISFH